MRNELPEFKGRGSENTKFPLLIACFTLSDKL